VQTYDPSTQEAEAEADLEFEVNLGYIRPFLLQKLMFLFGRDLHFCQLYSICKKWQFIAFKLNI
jgi:hypothetical protein